MTEPQQQVQQVQQPPQPKPRRPRTAAALGRACGVSRATASRWVRAGCPRNADGTFDPVAVAGWNAERKDRGGEGGGAEPTDVLGGAPVHDAGSTAAAEPSASVPAGADGEPAGGSLKERQALALLAWRQRRAELAALDVAERRRQLVPRALVAELLAGRAAEFRRALETGGMRLALELAGVREPAEIKRRFDAWAAGVLDAYSRPAPLDEEIADAG